jgi:hypothetical protein
MAKRRRRDTEMRRGGSKAQVIGYSDEGGEIGKVAAIHC